MYAITVEAKAVNSAHHKTVQRLKELKRAGIFPLKMNLKDIISMSDYGSVGTFYMLPLLKRG